MAMRDSISVRFPDAIREELESIAESSGLTSADLIRLATAEYLRTVKAEGSIKIPLARLGKVAESRAEHGSKKSKQ